MLLQPRSRRLAIPARLAQARTGVFRGGGKPPVWWHLGGAGFLALAVTGGLVALSGRGADHPRPETAHRTAEPKAAVQAQAPPKIDRPATAAPAPPPPAPVQTAPNPSPVDNPPLPAAFAANGPASAAAGPALAAIPKPAAPEPAPVQAVTNAASLAGPLPAVAVQPRSEPAASGDARPGSKPASDEQAAKGAVTAPADAPVACLPGALRAVLADVSGRFGPLTVVSTQHLNTRNHAAGSARHKLHQACKAVDFRMQKPSSQGIVTYLRSRPEVGGVESYRDGVIHIDLNENRTAAQPRPRPTARVVPSPAE